MDKEGLWAFGELYESPALSSLDSAWKRELAIFCYGTFLQHQQAHHVQLSEGQERKLRQLTVASLASRSGQVSYEELKRELQLQDLRALEDLLLDTMYQGLIEGKLDQRRQALIVDFAQGRDVRQEDLKRVSQVLDNWLGRSEALSKSIEERINTARSEITVEKMRKQEFEARVKEIKENLRAILEAQDGGDAEAHRRGLGGRRGHGHQGGGAGGGMMGGFMEKAQGIRRGFFGN